MERPRGVNILNRSGESLQQQSYLEMNESELCNNTWVQVAMELAEA